MDAKNIPLRLFATVSALLSIAGTVGCRPGGAEATVNRDGPSTRPTSFAVLELFTSEGCSSCPAADDLLAETATANHKAHRRVFPLAFHVDYWDRLGWKDPFSDPSYSARQREYAGAFPAAGLYTPQAIVNGSDQFVGSKPAAMEAAIGRALRAEPAAAAELSLRVSRKSPANPLVVGYAADPPPPGVVLNIAVVERHLSTKVPRGENGGRVLKHDHVVRAFRTVAPPADGRGELEVVVPAAVVAANAWVVGYVQDTKTKAVLAAAGADLPENAARPVAPVR